MSEPTEREASAYPWRLRLCHEGYASIRVERPGRWFRFDPRDPPGSGEVVVLTWVEPERTMGVRAALAQGQSPTVVATPPVRAWLHEQGQVDDHSPGGKHDKVRVDAIEYRPVPYATPPEALRKTRAALLNPAMAVKRLSVRARLPRCNPVVVQLTLPDGGRLLHLNCALHRDTDAEWLARAADRFGGADWTIVGVDYGEEEAVAELLPRFSPRQILVADLVNEARRDIGLPTGIVTPLVDRLCGMGLDAHPFVREATFRYEQDPGHA